MFEFITFVNGIYIISKAYRLHSLIIQSIPVIFIMWICYNVSGEEVDCIAQVEGIAYIALTDVAFVIPLFGYAVSDV